MALLQKGVPMTVTQAWIAKRKNYSNEYYTAPRFNETTDIDIGRVCLKPKMLRVVDVIKSVPPLEDLYRITRGRRRREAEGE